MQVFSLNASPKDQDPTMLIDTAAFATHLAHPLLVPFLFAEIAEQPAALARPRDSSCLHLSPILKDGLALHEIEPAMAQYEQQGQACQLRNRGRVLLCVSQVHEAGVFRNDGALCFLRLLGLACSLAQGTRKRTHMGRRTLWLPRHEAVRVSACYH